MADESLEVQGTSETPAGNDPTVEDASAREGASSDELLQKNQRLYARAKQAEENERKMKDELAAFRTTQEQSTPTPTEAPSAPSNLNTLAEAKDYARLIARGYSEDEIGFLERNRSGKESILDTAKDDFVKVAIEGMREKAKVAQATPAPTNRSNAVDAKPLEKMTKEEKSQKFSFDSWKANKRQTGA
jgi:hypothetical protein|tara:strand:- start:4063 stop:4626 length:564 start_codon:yes stop_codon:yes gene_type:complete